MSGTLLFIGNDTTIAFDLVDVDGVPATGGVMTATLYSGASQVTGQDWPLAMAESPAGTYSGVLLPSLVIADGEALRLLVTATHEGSTARWEHRFQGAVRRATMAV